MTLLLSFEDALKLCFSWGGLTALASGLVFGGICSALLGERRCTDLRKLRWRALCASCLTAVYSMALMLLLRAEYPLLAPFDLVVRHLTLLSFHCFLFVATVEDFRTMTVKHFILVAPAFVAFPLMILSPASSLLSEVPPHVFVGPFPFSDDNPIVNATPSSLVVIVLLAITIVTFSLTRMDLIFRLMGNRRSFVPLLLVPRLLARENPPIQIAVAFTITTFGTLGVWIIGGDTWTIFATAVLGSASAGAVPFVITSIASPIFGKQAMGSGDTLFVLSAGTMIGQFAGMPLLIFTSFTGVGWAILLASARKIRRQPASVPVIPFIPMLGLGAWLATLFWPAVLELPEVVLKWDFGW
ncbi:MAG: hypothetical protein KDD64_03935 [Bdellovibrionales bacterium]|nr:hypothetical protein [Bdellovibrionales bacterium]